MENLEGQDQVEKKLIPERLGMQEYWLFNPHRKWITEPLRGYGWSAEHPLGAKIFRPCAHQADN
ncbi:hypothetical protein VB712_02320 [Spirulina sp. CCNP1310]|uniref:hypothetical protein n=1 Tax=Spirulina sp. CCNP1310 TaxID=3110249 RepID=UPI002B20EB35|nr:hypothetical protein [Spirulina sp. CCNP1310]MEA5418041.1 hypothetical protein [Spirulina sp. CCNP1310]